MMPASNKSLTCVGAALGVMGAALLQAQQDRPSFRSNARLVEVSVVVTDRDRNPVRGLTGHDFQVFDDGKPQKVEVFWVEGSASAAPRATPTGEGAGEFSNRLPDTRGVTIILFDLFNTPFAARARSRDHVAKFLEQIKPDDRVG